jgi:hypothetical protein
MRQKRVIGEVALRRISISYANQMILKKQTLKIILTQSARFAAPNKCGISGKRTVQVRTFALNRLSMQIESGAACSLC